MEAHMDSTVIAEKMARDPLFNPKIMGLRSAEVKELRSSNPALATMATEAAASSHEPMKLNQQMYKSTTNISSISQHQPLREHNKRFSASALALHSNHMYTSSRGSSTTMLHSSYPAQDRSKSLRNLSNFNYKSLDKDDRAILTWLTGVVGYRITDYSVLYDGTVLCQLINTIKSNTIDVDSYRNKMPEERLQIVFHSIKEHLNINGPPAPVENIIEGRGDDLLFMYLQKIKLFYCTSYGPQAKPKMYSSTKSLNRSHSLSTVDNTHVAREYRSQTSSPHLFANNSCTNLESIKERRTTKRKAHRPHSYHELSTAHLMSSSGARVISVDTDSASEHEEENTLDGAATTADKSHTQVANDHSDNKSTFRVTSQVHNGIAKPSAQTTVSSVALPVKAPSDHIMKSNNTSIETKSQDGVEGQKQATPNMTPPRHQLPPLPKAAPPPLPPNVASVKRQLATQMQSTDGQKSLQTFLSLSNSRRDLTTTACETCVETQAKLENIIKKERELILYPLQRAFKSEKKKRIGLERRHRKAVVAAKRKINYYEQCIDELSEKVSSLTSQVESQQKLANLRLAELSKQVSSYKDELAYATSAPVTPPPQDVCSPTSTDDAVHSKKTFRLFRKITKKKPNKEKVDTRSVLQTTSLKFFPTKEYSEQVESLNTFLQRLGYSYLIEKFVSNDIGLKELVLMDEAHMEGIGIPVGPRLKILQEIQTLTADV